MPPAILFVFQLLDRIAPELAARLVYRFMSTPRRPKLRPHEREVLDQADSLSLTFRNGHIQGYAWGDPTHPTALLLHGWEGHAGNFGAIANLLVEKGYYVVAYDAPGHGQSQKVKTHMFEYVAFVRERMIVHKPELLVSHSFGSVTTMIAISETPQLSFQKWIAITTPYDFRDRIEELKDLLRVSDRTTSRLITKLERVMEVRIDQLNARHYANRISHVGELVIYHPIKDRIIPIEAARKSHAAIPGSRMIELAEGGHYSILWRNNLLNLLQEEIQPSSPLHPASR